MRAAAHDAVRRALCVALPLLALRRLHAADALPLRNLIVELRLDDTAAVDGGGAAGGELRIDSRGNVQARAEVRTLGSTRRTSSGLQSVRVLNGGRARMQLVQTQALVGAVAAWSGVGPSGPGAPPWGPPGARPGPPSSRPPDLRHPPPGPGGPGLPPGGRPPGWGPPPGGALVTAWAELVDGFEVRPQWPGGAAPVVVEIGAQRRVGVAGANALPPSFELWTTVQAPLDEWTELAQVQQDARATARWGSTTAASSQVARLELRVSLAD